MKIFVSIAAYRDPELVPTIEHCLARARYPESLRFGVCWQHAPDEQRPPDLGAQLRLRDVPWQESQGACWARAEIMKLWDGEDYFLQIDSHMRFMPDWDLHFLAQCEATGADKPLLTTYPASYEPQARLPDNDLPTALMLRGFEGGVPSFNGRALKPREIAAGPMRARFLSANMLFTLGSFVEDVPYDPDLYFMGEEITLAVRAFTHGYSLRHPARHIMWHRTSRNGRPLHWNDHEAAARDAESRRKVEAFLADPPVGRFGLGTARCFADYFAYAGVDFKRRTAIPAARNAIEPPPEARIGAYLRSPQRQSFRIEIPRERLPPAAFDRSPFWYVAFLDADGREVARQDADRHEIRRMAAGGGATIAIERSFLAKRPVARWTVQPTDRALTWLAPIQGALQ